jgi:hypothetical protein
LSFLLKWSGILCVPGGLLWALSPTGISVSNLAFHTPNVFWKMFWSAPLLILLGLVGLLTCDGPPGEHGQGAA